MLSEHCISQMKFLFLKYVPIKYVPNKVAWCSVGPMSCQPCVCCHRVLSASCLFFLFLLVCLFYLVQCSACTVLPQRPGGITVIQSSYLMVSSRNNNFLTCTNGNVGFMSVGFVSVGLMSKSHAQLTPNCSMNLRNRRFF